jgi:hypothetical protein
VQAAYEVRQDGVVEAPVPGRCPLGEDGSACEVVRHDWRARKSGPEHPLMVCRCRPHRVFFTVYPPAYVPYGRVAVVEQDSEGRVVRGDALDSTLFGAALEARDADASGVRRMPRRTLTRRLEWCAAMLGLSGRVPERGRDTIADTLWVPRLAVREGAQAYGASRRLCDRAAAVLTAWTRVPLIRRHAGVFVAGYVAGLWGRPSRWDPGGAMLRPLV